MLNASVDVQRVIARLRPTRARRSATAISLQRRSTSGVGALRIPRSVGRPRLSGERAVSLWAIGLVAAAVAISNVGVAAAGGSTGNGYTGNTSGAGSEPRIALGGAVSGLEDAPQGGITDQVDGYATDGDLSATSGLSPDGRVSIDGPFDASGTLVKPGSVDTTVSDGKALMRSYKVRSGDTLTGIANHFGVSMMTLWWANNLQDPNLVVGQTLTIPGAISEGIPTPKPVKTTTTRTTTHASGGSSRPPAQYTGGRFHWPVAGGYISQYFHYGHYAIDIAADYGTKVMAAASGTVIFAGWKNNGGGYQVWISHGSNLYTTYNHMSAITVGRGQSVSRGQQVGRVGMTGNATGPHLHFEVWIGPIWNGGTRVNPLIYL